MKSSPSSVIRYPSSGVGSGSPASAAILQAQRSCKRSDPAFRLPRFLLLLAVALPLLAAPKSSDELVRRYAELDQLLAAKNYRQGVKVLKEMIRDFGKSSYADELRFGLAECYFNLGEYTRARDEFLGITNQPTHSYIEPEALYGYAISQIMLGQYDEAEQAVQQMVKRKGYENDQRTNFAFGVLRYFRKDYAGAIARMEDDSLLEAIFYLGKSYARVERPREALLAFKRITNAVPGTALATLAHFAAGEALFMNRDFDGAQAKFQYFLDNFGDSPLADFAHYFLGCALIHGKRYELAMAELMPLTRSPNIFLAAHANYFVGYCNLYSDKAQDAVARFQKVRANYPKTRVASYANLQLTQALLATGDTAQTILSTSQLSTMFTTGELQAVGDYLSGVITMQIGQHDRSANFFENILIKYPQSPLREPACALLLQTLNTGGSFERAVTVGAKYVRDFPDSTVAAHKSWRPKLLYALAEGYYYLHQFSEAESHYRRSFEAPLNTDIAPYARLGRAYCLIQLDRTGEAIEALRVLGPAKPGDTAFIATVILGLGYAFFNQGEYDSARMNFEYITERYPKLRDVVASAQFHSGMCYRKLGYPGDAIDAWASVVSENPNDPRAGEAAFRAGDTYFKSGDYEKAISMFRFVTERFPFSTYGPSAQAFIGQCYYNQRQFVNAIREHQKFLDLHPTDAQAQSVRRSLEMDYYRAGLEDSSYMATFLRRYPESELAAQAQFDHALARMQARDFAGAAQEFQLVVVNFPGSSFAAKAQLNAGECYASLENWQQAADAYSRYLVYFPGTPEHDAAEFNLGVSWFQLNEYEKALKSFQAILDSFPQSQYTENAKKNVDICKKRLGVGGPRLPAPTPAPAESTKTPVPPPPTGTPPEKK